MKNKTSNEMKNYNSQEISEDYNKSGMYKDNMQ